MRVVITFCHALHSIIRITFRVTSACEADVGVFFAYTDKCKGHKGITAFIVPFNTPGVEIGPREEKLGIRASSTCDIFLNNVQIPESNVIGGVGNGFEIAMRQLQLGRIGVAAQAIGIGRAAFDLAKSYSLERMVLGERLCDKQLVKVSDIQKKTNKFPIVMIISLLVCCDLLPLFLE